MNESIVKRIEDLILETNDPKDRALLLIQLEMVKSLIENTEVTKELHAEFQVHAKEEMAMIIKGRFLWRVLLAFALILQVGLGWMFNRHVTAFDKIADDVTNLHVEIETHKEHHKQEERYREGSKVK